MDVNKSSASFYWQVNTKGYATPFKIASKEVKTFCALAGKDFNFYHIKLNSLFIVYHV